MSSWAAPFSFTWASKALPRTIANRDWPNGAGKPACAATRCLSTPAASIRARRAQPGLAARAEIVRASWFFGSARPRSRSRAACAVALGWRPVTRLRPFRRYPAPSPASAPVSGSVAEHGGAEELLGVVQAARPLGGCPPDPGVGVAMHGQLGPRRLADRGRVGPAAGRDRPGDGGREPFEQAAGRGRRLRYPLDRLGHPDRRRQEVNPRRERADHAQLERPGRDREQAPGRGQVVGRERRANVVGPGERRGAERALLVPLEAGDPGGGERRAEERLVHGGDELGGGRHLQQAERLVDLLAQRQQRPRPGGRLVRRGRPGLLGACRSARGRPRRARPPTPARPT